MYRNILIFLICLFMPVFVRATVKSYMITNWDGLSNANPTCVVQDGNGLLWIGTWDGLNVYDGHDFKVYKHNPDIENSLSESVVWQIDNEGDRYVWAATDYGVNRIDVKKNTIRRFYLGYDEAQPSERKAFSVAVSDSGTVFASANGSCLAYYDKEKDQMVLFNAPMMNAMDVSKISCLGENHLIVLLSSGDLFNLEYFVDESGMVDILKSEKLPIGARAISIYDCHENIYVATDNRKLMLLDNESGQISNIIDLPSSDVVSAVEKLPDGSIIVAFKTFKVYRIKDGAAARYAPLDGKNVAFLFYGSQDILWAAIDDKGLEAIYKDEVNIGRLLSSELFGESSGQISKMSEDSHGNIYVASQGNGIYSLQKDGAKHFFNMSNGLRNNRVTSISKFYGSKVFIGNDAGIDVLDIDSGTISPLSNPNNDDAFSYCIFVDEAHSCLWVGFFGNGLMKYEIEPHGNSFRVVSETHYLSDPDDSTSLSNNTVMCVKPAGKGRLWVGTLGGGLNLLDISTGRFTHFTHNKYANSLSNSSILDILDDQKNSCLWVGTSYGLNKCTFNKDGSMSVRNYFKADGLLDDTVHGMLIDDNDRLWFSSNKGLSYLNVKTEKICNFIGRNYLQNMEFSNGSCLRSSNGMMYFGGMDGINYFDPRTIQLTTYAPDIHFSRFMVRQRQLDDFLSSPVLKLRHDENFFTISFSAIDFINNDNSEYTYILEGFDTTWVDNGTSNNAVFTNVPPGKYTFKVKIKNVDYASEAKAPASLSILIMRPWWKTFWAYLFYILAILCLILLSIREAKLVIKRREARQKAEQEIRHQEETYEAKLRFFTNITHEFGTPLTLISSAEEQLHENESLSPKSSKYLDIIKNSADRMQRLISEILEFRKVDTGNYVPEYSKFDMCAMLSNIVDNFSELQDEQGISLTVDKPKAPLMIVSDHKSIEKIIYNLLSNAFKYTPIGGDILVSLYDDGKTHLIVRNSGHGISSEKLDSVFDRFVILDKIEMQAKRGKISRTGIGLALTKSLVDMLQGSIKVDSVVNEYTEFSVVLPHLDESLVESEAPEIQQDAVSVPDIHKEEDEITERYSGKEDGKKVMIVDDEASIRDLVGDILGDEYRVIKAKDGLDAMEVMKHERPDLVITDLSMPEMDGTSLIKNMKDNDFTKYISVIILTFNAGEEDQVRGYQLGVDAFISKPFTPKHLKAVVGSVLGNQTLMREFYNSSISSKDVFQSKVINAEDKDFMLRLTKIVDDNISDENLSLDFLCSQMAVSRIQLYRKLKDITGSSPTVFIRNVRLEKAAHLLQTTNMTVMEIMFKCGFSNRAYFYREFSKKYNMTPKNYKKATE